MIVNKKFRFALTRKSHFWFFHFYFRNYVKFATADFQKKIIKITEDDDNKLAAIVAFRGSSKSTIVTQSYVLWSVLGKQKKKFVAILSQTQKQTKQHFMNIKTELEQNHLLREDLGPFSDKTNEWGNHTLVLQNCGARITAVSRGGKIRGSKHLEDRPDLIICDDVEDLQSTRTREERDKTYNWFKGDIIPSGTIDTKIIIVGNLLHEDSLLKRIQQEILEKKLDGIYEEFPLIGNDGKTLWPGKYPTPESIEVEKKKIGDEITWQREFLLRILPNYDQVIHKEWVHYYEDLPKDKYRYLNIGVDLAITESDSADYTAMVSAKVYGYREDMQIYILPNLVNEHFNFTQTVEACKLLQKNFGEGDHPKFLIEEVGYQKALTDTLEKDGIPAKGVKVNGQDKRARLSLTANLIKSGKVLFPKQGTERLIEQIVGFGTEKHDDLVDAFTLLVLEIISDRHVPVRLEWL